MTTKTQARSARINGAELRYADVGSGEPAIVFVHGWTCNRGDWRHQIEAFGESHRVVAYDQRGHGESEKPDEDYTIDGFADDLAALIEDLGIERPIIVGHSMGGVITNSLVRREPEMARGVVLVDAPIMPVTDALRALVTGFLAGLQTPNYVELSRQFNEAMMFNEGSDPEMKRQILDDMAEAPRRMMHTAIASLIDEAEKHSGPIPVPALYLRATTNTSVPEALLERFPGMELKEIVGAHFLQLERPDEVNEAIGGFIERLEEAYV